MITFRKATANDLSEISTFISKCNQNPKSHIGFCGSDQHEIQNALLEDLSDIPFTESFVLTFEADTLIGVLGFDYDLSRSVAEIWGPFVEVEYSHTLDDAWKMLLKLLPESTQRTHFFPSAEHSLALDWLKDIRADFMSEELTLTINKPCMNALETSGVSDLTQAFENFVSHLHDLSFPKTYYSGEEILKRLNETKKIFVHTVDDKLSGYIYVEVNPQFNEGSIEFFSVDPLFRGQGIGQKLIVHALNFIFSFEEIGEVQLCVSNSNPTAIHLYEKVGFKRKQALCFLTKTMT